MEPGIAFNTAVSFVTNTNWQSYVPETVMGHLVQMAGLTVQNFVSAAVGMAVAVALVRGFVRAGSDRIGNFWVDLVRGAVRVLLPISFVAAIVLVALGVTMSLHAGVDVTGVDGQQSTIALAPTASQEAIKELGTNGGGIFNANSAHPFENPNGLTNLLEIFLLLVIPVCLTRAFGVMVRDTRQGHVLLAVMGVLWGGLLAVAWWAETHPNGPATLAAGAALEGKEVRFGIPASVLFAVSTTGTSTGAVNSLHDSYTGLGGGVTLLNMLLGEVAPGGVGAGLYGILVLAVIAVFLAGLMVGRTPEYLGKKLGRARGDRRGDLDPGHADGGAARRRRRAGPARRARRRAGQHRRARPVRGALRLRLGRQQQRQRVRRAHRDQPVLPVHARRWPCCSAGSCRSWPCSRWPARWPRRSASSPAPAPCPPPARCSAVLVGGTIVLVAALTFFPALALGPIAEALVMTTAHPRPALDRRAPRPARASAPAAPSPPARSPPPARRRRCPARCASSTRAPSCATRSCSWSGSARCWSPARRSPSPSVFAWLIAIWLWFTVLFANLAEAVAEGRGKAQAESLRRTRTETDGPPAARRRDRGARCRAPRCGSATGWSSRPARSSPATATSSRASPPSTSRRSPASRRR